MWCSGVVHIENVIILYQAAHKFICYIQYLLLVELSRFDYLVVINSTNMFVYSYIIIIIIIVICLVVMYKCIEKSVVQFDVVSGIHIMNRVYRSKYWI